MKYIYCQEIAGKTIYTCKILLHSRWIEISADCEEEFYKLLSSFFENNDYLENTNPSVIIEAIL